MQNDNKCGYCEGACTCSKAGKVFEFLSNEDHKEGCERVDRKYFEKKKRVKNMNRLAKRIIKNALKD